MENLFEDKEVNEIIIHENKNIIYEKQGEFFSAPFALAHYESEYEFYKDITSQFQKAPDFSYPISSGVWKDFRVQVVTAPAHQPDSLIQLRRISQIQHFGSFKPEAWSVDSEAFSILEKTFTTRKSFMIIGPTGSGKTTLLQSLLFSFCKLERCLVLEDDHEITLPNEFSSTLTTYTSSSPEIPHVTLQDLVKASLRLRPDRIIMGEMRGEEAAQFLLVLSTGHQGSGATLHAHSPQEALYRLEMLTQMGQPHWSVHTIRRLLRCSITHLILTDKVTGAPRIKGIYEISGLEDTGFLIDSLYETSDETSD